MKIIDVENMTSEQIKAQRKEAIAAAREAGDVAERYVQARLDATLRDEKLAEQGETIKLLQNEVKRLGAINEAHESELASRAAANTVARSQLADLQKELRAASGELSAEQTRRQQVEAVSKSRRTVLAKLQGMIATELAAE